MSTLANNSTDVGGNPTRSNSGWPPAVIGSVFQTGLNLIRDLEQKGVRAVGVDCFSENVGFISRYGKSHLCPDPQPHPSECVAFMKDFSRSFDQKPVFIATADLFVSALGAFAGELKDYYIFSQTAVEKQAALTTKDKQYELAHRYGLPCPRSTYVQSTEELREFARTARFPCLIKPLQHRVWEDLPSQNPLCGKKVVCADTADGLIELYKHTEGFDRGVVAQEFVVGGDDAKYCYLSVYGRGAVRLGYCVVREFRAYPVYFGSGSIVEPVVDDEIAAVCDDFLRAIGYEGLCEIEVKRDARDGKVLLIEVNPRFSVTGDCARYAGVETGWLHYLDLIGQPVQPVMPTRYGFKHIVLQRDLATLPKCLEDHIVTFRGWLASYVPPVKYYDLDWRDPRVSAHNLYWSLRRCAGNMLRYWKLR